MKMYEFNLLSIDKMYDEVCSESINAVSMMHAIRQEGDGQESGEQLIDSLLNHIDIKVSIGSHTLVIPSNADNIETLFAAIRECFKQTTED